MLDAGHYLCQNVDLLGLASSWLGGAVPVVTCVIILVSES